MSNVVTLRDTKGWSSDAPSYSTSTMDKSRVVSTFKPFFGDSKKAANVEETPVEARMRKALVHTLVKHSMRCATVKGEDRAALVIQRYWRSYAAARVLRRLLLEEPGGVGPGPPRLGAAPGAREALREVVRQLPAAGVVARQQPQGAREEGRGEVEGEAVARLPPRARGELGGFEGLAGPHHVRHPLHAPRADGLHGAGEPLMEGA